MATNAEPTVDDSTPVTEEDLRSVKENSEVESSPTDETLESEAPEEESEEAVEEESEEESSEFVKEFSNIKGDTAEEYARNLENAYKNSTAEALRLKGLVDSNDQVDEIAESDDSPPIDPRLLYLDGLINKEIQNDYEAFSKDYSQTQDPEEYAKFTKEAANLSRYILDTQKRVAPASELYSKVAAILGWTPETAPTDKDKLNVALKDSASMSKTSTTTKQKSSSKVTDAQIAVAKQMGGWTDGKSDAEIRKELESI